QQLFDAMAGLGPKPDEEFHQGDAPGKPTDFFTPIVPAERLNRVFKVLTEQERWSPARGVIDAMMRFYEDTDGNFVEQFQTTAFADRICELYLFATFPELGYVPNSSLAVPDFIFTGLPGAIGIEATSANPVEGGAAPPPKDQDALQRYLENFVPIKL